MCTLTSCCHRMCPIQFFLWYTFHLRCCLAVPSVAVFPSCEYLFLVQTQLVRMKHFLKSRQHKCELKTKGSYTFYKLKLRNLSLVHELYGSFYSCNAQILTGKDPA